jgi:hypothetical protein
MLERTRAGEVPVLRDVARHHDRDPLFLGHPDEGVRAVPDLRHAAGHLGRGRIAHRLDGVHRQEERRSLAGRAQHGRQIAARREGDRITRHTEPSRPGRDLRVGLLARHEEALPPTLGETSQELQQQGGLADPRLTREEDHRRGNESAAEDPIQTLDPGRHTRLDRRGPPEHQDGRDGPACPSRALDRAPGPAARAATDPLGHLLPAIRAGEEGPGTGHGRLTVATGSDTP